MSFASGKPIDQLFQKLDEAALLRAFVSFKRGLGGGQDAGTATAKLLQYGPTAGIITDPVARQLQNDDGVPAHPEQMVITNGCQEALALCIPALCPDPQDVLLVRNPTYAGASCAASASRVQVFPIAASSPGLPHAIEQAVESLARDGRRVRALYLTPTFDNPTGCLIDEGERKAVLAVCARRRVIVLEDNPYGLFRYEGPRPVAMAALDETGCVIYLSTYSKTLAPALRVGALTIPQSLFGDRAASRQLRQTLLVRKSYVSLNSSQITQAIAGGLLLQQNCSLLDWTKPALECYRANRHAMLTQLDAELGRDQENFQWNSPTGGFFLTLTLPFDFDSDDLAQCARDYSVIVMPMRYFAFDPSQNRRIRLSFSSHDPDSIRRGVTQLARYLRRRLTARRATPARTAVGVLPLT